MINFESVNFFFNNSNGRIETVVISNWTARIMPWAYFYRAIVSVRIDWLVLELMKSIQNVYFGEYADF